MRLVQIITDYIRRSILTTQGDLVVRGVGQPEKLAAGAAGTFLKGQGAGVIPAYEAAPTIPAMRVTLSSNQVIPTGVETKVNFNTIGYDTTSDFDVVNHRWVCGEAGVYLVCLCLYILSLADNNLFAMLTRVNGTSAGTYSRITTGGVGDAAIMASDIYSLSINDYIEPIVYHNFGANRMIDGGLIYNTYFAVHKLS